MRHLRSSSLNKFHLVNRDRYLWVAFGYPIHCSNIDLNIPYNPTSKTRKNLILFKIFYILFQVSHGNFAYVFKRGVFQVTGISEILKRLLVKSGQVFPNWEENTYLDLYFHFFPSPSNFPLHPLPPPTRLEFYE